ncbi:anti-sigma factor domain-containing protein [Sporosarcina sp. Marseille-Q4943]|uniref:anti-sigma-I factor RsgI family protein n=1 Tax=Sporosarcina sp. Marseille-Q4943 TaxID=2942204 RepID=UPI00208DCD6C|nr:anti-sigma factor domain-containing protein [Sporosarcina sp. Marseille-Q4943]
MMRTYRGIVCEKKNKYMVFLTEKGEFLRGVPIGDPPAIGEEADFTLVASSFIAGRKAKSRFVGAVFVAAALLFIILSSLNPLNEKVMAYVQLDAGTAMEFGVNRDGNVISLRYLNEKQSELERLDGWKGHPILNVLDMAVLQLSVHDKKIIITTIYPTRGSELETRQMIGDAVREVRGKHNELTLQITESTPEERKVANKKKMSIHKFKSIEIEGQPVDSTGQIENKPGPEQKPKKEIVPPSPPQQKRMEKENEKERPKGSTQHQGPPTEKLEKNPSKGQSENVPPHADQHGTPPHADEQGPPPHSLSTDKQVKDDQGPPAKQQKENSSNEHKQNPQNKK